LSSDRQNQTEELKITGPYGPLSAIFHAPAAGGNGYALVFCHGFRGSKDGGGGAAFLAQKVAAAGFSVLRFDFTPQRCLSQQVKELAAVVEYCRISISRQVILLGRSMGGSAALAFSAADRNIAGLCLWAAPWDLAAVFQLTLGYGYDCLVAGEELLLEDDYGQLHLTPEFIRDFSNFNLLENVKSLNGAPLLVVHGSDDATVPLVQAQTLYLTARQPKEIVVISGGDHQFLNCHFAASDAVLSWLAKMFANNGI